MGAPIKERFHSKIRHSDFFSNCFLDKYWIPFLNEGTVVQGDNYQNPPLVARLLSALRIKYFILFFSLVFFSNWSGLSLGLTNSSQVTTSGKLESKFVDESCSELMVDQTNESSLFEVTVFEYGIVFIHYPVASDEDDGEETVHHPHYLKWECSVRRYKGPLVPLYKLRELYLWRGNGVSKCPRSKILSPDSCQRVINVYEE
jgi:hypothetical protein